MAEIRSIVFGILGAATVAGLAVAGGKKICQEHALEKALRANGDGDWSAEINWLRHCTQVTGYFDDSHYARFYINMKDATGQSDELALGHRESYTSTYMQPVYTSDTKGNMTICYYIPQQETAYHYYDDRTESLSQMSDSARKIEADIRANLSQQKLITPSL